MRALVASLADQLAGSSGFRPLTHLMAAVAIRVMPTPRAKRAATVSRALSRPPQASASPTSSPASRAIIVATAPASSASASAAPASENPNVKNVSASPAAAVTPIAISKLRASSWAWRMNPATFSSRAAAASSCAAYSVTLGPNLAHADWNPEPAVPCHALTRPAATGSRSATTSFSPAARARQAAAAASIASGSPPGLKIPRTSSMKSATDRARAAQRTMLAASALR
jgi:hypothetical protein